MSSLPPVDWSLAATIGRRLVRSGAISETPELGGTVQACQVAVAVEELHAAADQAMELVMAESGFSPQARPAIYAVDRATWAQANTEIGYALFARIRQDVPPSWLRDLFSKSNALIVAGTLRFLGSRVLGQYDPFHPGGRLLLVVPNILMMERRLGINPADFRLWTGLHEQTHAVQFAVAPWLLDHLVSAFVTVLDDRRMRWFGKLSSRASKESCDALDATMAIMSLLEGHAQVITENIGRRVIASAPTLKRVFDPARGRSQPDWLHRLGLLTKSEQYARGSSFCREVIELAGMETLNQAFVSPQGIPSLAELSAPHEWVERVHGQT